MLSLFNPKEFVLVVIDSKSPDDRYKQGHRTFVALPTRIPGRDESSVFEGGVVSASVYYLRTEHSSAH